ncbi:uncharacterized protein NECHADRAFT_73198 [Fusarium vanettenii 77-13-4]|uniref:Zn(2)-C6 fungal-type domain-containing protein n=1 Tax=Fusarium vanettenii (strain ATCC MYA-4622 / CBS 123669 / FGSC 9596 / NRRL 45880 / 77-13-4) TaxID=660122 RepID=C7ZMB2_FUSV7|nr:uncharacterized protein NECHADRAFT_73198 [Fusarium vanettenii 77-13-4]EEU34805.1 hypothetical protein NECHADRAFT_73198 [Fusarium vanettenii 77-13-4]
MSSSSEAKARIQARKIRKGTHSCWECRRRKIRCQFSAPGDLVCTPCRNRGSICRGQEVADESEASQLSMRHLARRLSRLEELMEKLAEQSTLGSSTDVFTQHSPGFSYVSMDEFEQSRATKTGGNAVRPGVSTFSSSCDAASSFTSGTPQETNVDIDGDRTLALSKTLYKLFPTQGDVNAILEASVGSIFVTRLFHRQADVADGNSEPPEAVGAIPSPSSRPTLLAKRLLQLVICMQQISPTFTEIVDRVDKFITADRFVSTFEGLECLLLLGYWQQNAGNLRKAWIIFRRALNVGQLMGINTAAGPPPSTPFSSRYPPSPAMLWFRSVACDRYLSLLLGLPAGSHDNSFAAPPQMVRDAPREKLEKLHAVVSERMIERNNSTQAQAYRWTQLISRDLLAGQGLMGEEWWKLPLVDSEQSLRSVPEVAGRIILQMNHHLLLILLHIPYLLKNPSPLHGEQSSKAICTSSSRNVLERFRAFRNLNDSAFSCRHVDYTALVAAMTLLVSHAQHGESRDPANDESIHRSADEARITAVKDRMKDLAYLNSDKLFEESSDIIDRLLPLLTSPESESPSPPSLNYQLIELRIPYFGTIKIATPPAQLRPVHETKEAQRVEPLELRTDKDAKTQTVSTESSHLASSDMEPVVPIHFHPENDQNSFSATDITAGADAWPLQGIDATYWALLQTEWNA